MSKELKKEDMYNIEDYNVSGAIGGGVFEAVLGLVLIGMVATVLTVFGGVLSGQVYSTSQTQIAAITNTTIRGYVENSIGSSFQAQQQNASFQPLLFLALIMGVVITVILGSVRGAVGGSAL